MVKISHILTPDHTKKLQIATRRQIQLTILKLKLLEF